MKFKKLSLLGFKSFANKLEVKFGEGITAIVGPNGCGKSNVADAVRWVLGEQSAKLLRGSNMQDVIFNGTQKRKALSYAEVSLTFDNHNRSLFPSYEYEEVVVTRKLFRSGESEYYRNGSLCRLRDISEMLRDGGFAIEGYTIIGQGRVMEIINSKPEDRRSIFEEAAGISKYKYKKQEAERKNARTRDNLNRLNDILSNDTERLAPLARQAEKTRTYRELKEKLKYNEINLYINQFETASTSKAAISEVIAEIDAQIAEKQAELDKAKADYNFAVGEVQSIDDKLNAYHSEMLELSVGKQKAVGDIAVINQRLDGLNRENTAYMTDNAELNDRCDYYNATIAEKQSELNRKTEKLKSDREECGRIGEKHLEIVDKVAREEARLAEARRALIAAIERRAAVNRSVGELTAERANLTRLVEEYTARVESGAAKIEETTAKLSERQAELDKLRGEREEFVAQKERETAESGECIKKLNDLVAEIGQAKQDFSALASRKRVIEDVQKDAYSHAVRKLLDDAKTDGRLASAVVGVVGQVITVKDGFEAAIDMALGSAVNNVITHDEDGAKLLVEHLKRNKYGRATFLPITSFKPRSIDAQYEHLLDRDGCFGVATNAIEYDGKFDSVMRGLLGGTVIVDNVDTAVELAKMSKYSFRIVTLDGDIVSQQGSITGGSKKSDATNVFAQERTLKELTTQVDAVKTQIEKAQNEREELNKRSESLARHIRELSEDIHDYELIETAKRAENTALTAELNAMRSNKEVDEEALANVNSRLADIIADLDLVEKSQDELETAQQEKSDGSDAEFEALRAERDRLQNNINDRNLEIVSLEKDIDALNTEIARLKGEVVAASQRISANEMSILSNNRIMQSFEERLRELTDATSDNADKHRTEIEEKINGLSQYKNDMNKLAVDSDAARTEVNAHISELTEKKHAQEISLAQIDVNMDLMQQRVGEEYGLGYEDCLQFKDEAFDAEAGELEIAKLRRRIANLGNIHENAIEEAQELSQKCSHMTMQRDDMMKSLADEDRIIKEMSANMMRDFDDCFEKIRSNFREIFTELFNGGTADLELTENEDPLARGVEIKAQPPEKQLQSITLLSGGEKTLTAIAILFAIMKLRPMPFCLLDEIEAALDDANVGRVAAMLKKFSDNTQLIAITHRKPTMEMADCLYGVTMEEKGVSSIVSVRLADALKNAETIDADDAN